MQVTRTALPEVLLLTPKVFADSRGFFLESYQQEVFDSAIGYPVRFVQDNHSGSQQGVLRGLHYQARHMQGKLIRVLAGAIYDVAVDIRKDSPRYGQHVGIELNSETKQMLWIPPGFAHGFLTLASWNEVYYKATDFYAPEFERTIRWDDPDIAIPWPLGGRTPVLSGKDMKGSYLSEAEALEVGLVTT